MIGAIQNSHAANGAQPALWRLA